MTLVNRQKNALGCYMLLTCVLTVVLLVGHLAHVMYFHRTGETFVARVFFVAYFLAYCIEHLPFPTAISFVVCAFLQSFFWVMVLWLFVKMVERIKGHEQ